MVLLRIVLILFCLVELNTLPSLPDFDSSTLALILVAYAVFSFIIAWLPIVGKIRTGWQLPVHLIDIAVVSYLMYYSWILSSTFFVLYIFVLMNATFRWNWRGAIWTTAVILALDVLMFAVSRSHAPLFFIEFAFLCIIGGMFAFFGIGRQRNVDRLNNIAAWPAAKIQSQKEIDSQWLGASLAHIANVLEAPRVFVLWEIDQEPYAFVTHFADGKCQQERVSSDIFSHLISKDLNNAVFASDTIKLKECYTAQKIIEVSDQIIDPSIVAKYKISSVCSAGFVGENCKGRIFVLDRPSWGLDYLSLVEIAAVRICIEVEYYSICVQLEQTAASQERTRLSHDLHDGTLQSLAAAALQLKHISDHSNGRIQEEIDGVRRLISSEQRNIRAFVDGRNTTLSEEPIKLSAGIRRVIKKLEDQWDRIIHLQSITPQGTSVSDELMHQIEYLISEAVANSVQHGHASRIELDVEQQKNKIRMRISDDGQGLPGTLGTYNQFQLASLGIGPQSILKRITDLRGTLSLVSTRHGIELNINFAWEPRPIYSNSRISLA